MLKYANIFVYLALVYIFVYFLVDVTSLLTRPMNFAADDWVDFHQYFYMSAVLMAFIYLFPKIKLPTTGLIAFFLSYWAYQFDVFDGHLHQFFISSGFYNLINPHFAGNPQYSKLVLYFLFISTYLIVVVVPRWRSIQHIFILLLLFVNLAVVGLSHYVLPSGILKSIANVESERMSATKKLGEAELKNICTINHWNCRSFEGGSIKDIHSIELSDSSSAYLDELRSQNPDQLIETVRIDLNMNPSVYQIVDREKENSFYEIFEFKKIFLFWQLGLGYLSFFSFFVSFGWYYLVIGLSIIHKGVKI